MSDHVLLITGGTGKQGGAVVDALIAGHFTSTILAVTRDTESAGAKKLAAKSPNIKLLKGDLEDAVSIFRTALEITPTPIWGVFSVQTSRASGTSTEQEETQAKGLIDKALKNGVKHFVQASVDRGGDEKSWSNETNIPHFASKHHIELYLRDQVAKHSGSGSMTYTILRPVSFMDNFAPGFGTSIFITALKNELHGKPLQLVAVKDIGVFGANAFFHADSPSYRNKAIGLAGDSLTIDQLVQIFEETTSNPPKLTFGIIGSALLWAFPKQMGIMIKWFGSDGYNVDLEKCREMNRDMMDMRTWLDQSLWLKK